MSNRLLDEPCDLHAEIGSKPWARAVAREIRYSAKKLDSDVNHIQEFISIAAKHEAWKVLGYVSLDAFLIKEANFTQAIIDAIRNAKGGTVGDAYERAEKEQKKQQGKRNDLTSTKFDEVKSSNTNENVLRRLARDHTELFEAAKRGELSVNAAAIQAGIRKKPTPEEQCFKWFQKCIDKRAMLDALLAEFSIHHPVQTPDTD